MSTKDDPAILPGLSSFGYIDGISGKKLKSRKRVFEKIKIKTSVDTH